MYQTVDKIGNIIDFILSKKRDKKAAFHFFCKIIGKHGLPEKITIDKSGINKVSIDKMNLLLTLLFLLAGIFLPNYGWLD